MDVTKETYNTSAAELAEFFAGFGSRKDDIELAFGAVRTGAKTCKVLELGCGDGRDATDILARTDDYLGIDYSKELIKLAQQKNPRHADTFHVADMKTFAAGTESYDVIFAFASFLHLSSEELCDALAKYCDALKPGGVLCMSFKQSDTYEVRSQVDQFGERVFYSRRQYPDRQVGAACPSLDRLAAPVVITLS